MKKALFIFLFFCSVCKAQNNQIDSALTVLKTEKEDTIKFHTAAYLSTRYYIKSNYEKAFEYANASFELAQKINFKRGIFIACMNMSNAYRKQGKYAEALKVCMIGLKAAQVSGDKGGLAFMYSGMAAIYTRQGKYPEAISNYINTLNIYETLGSKSGISKIYNNIGIVYSGQGNYSEALKNFNASLKIKKEMGALDDDLAGSYLNIGEMNERLGNNTEAKENYLTALSVSEKIDDKQVIASCYNALGSISMGAVNYQEALKYALKAMEMGEEMGDKESLSAYYGSVGYLYLKLKKYPEAKLYLNKSLSLSKEIGIKDVIKGAYSNIVLLDCASGNYKQALADYRTYSNYKDSMHNEVIMKQTDEMKAKYESEKKEKEIALLTKDNEIQNIEIKKQKQLKYSFIGGLTLVILLLLFGYPVYRGRQMLRLQDIRNKIAGDLHDDIGSTLNSISVYSEVAKKNDSQREEALEMIGDSSRKIIDAMSDIVWAINPDNDNFGKIIFRMKSLAHNLLRAKNIEYTFHAEEVLDEKKLSLEDRRNFYLIFKEAINNLVKYSEANRVSISLSNENDRMKLNIRDNGVGFDMTKENAGNGLKSMKRRADEMKAKFKIESQPGSGTQIELILAA